MGLGEDAESNGETGKFAFNLKRCLKNIKNKPVPLDGLVCIYTLYRGYTLFVYIPYTAVIPYNRGYKVYIHTSPSPRTGGPYGPPSKGTVLYA
jgi:hypothetical protein